MTEKCFDEGTIQAFLDGELDLESVDQVSRHVALCDSCAMAVAEAEGEMDFAFSALDNEFNTLVPTERLWTKINNSIETEAKNKSVWQSVLAFLMNPSTVAFASLLIVFGLFVGLYSLKNDSDNGLSAKNSTQPTQPTKKVENINLTGSSKITPVNDSATASTDSEIKDKQPQTTFAVKRETESDFRVRKAVYYPEKTRSETKIRTERNNLDAVNPTENLVAEESYVKTISTLEKTVNSRKDEVFKPSARFAFERDMAVADDTIKKLKEEVRNNPGNEAARVLLRNSYQNKINLLNSVAERTELMASLN